MSVSCEPKKCMHQAEAAALGCTAGEGAAAAGGGSAAAAGGGGADVNSKRTSPQTSYYVLPLTSIPVHGPESASLRKAPLAKLTWQWACPSPRILTQACAQARTARPLSIL